MDLSGLAGSRKTRIKIQTEIDGTSNTEAGLFNTVSRSSTHSGYLRLFPPIQGPRRTRNDRNYLWDSNDGSYAPGAIHTSGESLHQNGDSESTDSDFDTNQDGGFELDFLNPSGESTVRNSRPRVITEIHSIFEPSLDNGTQNELIQKSLEGLDPLRVKILQASWAGQLETLYELLPGSGDVVRNAVNCKDREGRTPLMIASAFGHSQAVQFLIQKGATVKVWDKSNTATPLICAAACGSLPAVEILIAHGADVNDGLTKTKTPLHWSISCGSEECVKKLLEAGAIQNLLNVDLGTPLHLAATLSRESCMKLLLQHGASVGIYKGSKLWTALHCATEEGSTECIELLIKAGASLEAKDSRAQTALHIAASNGDVESMGLLLSYKANPNVRDADGRTPLHRAVSKGTGSMECLLMLLEYKAEIDSQDKIGYTPLHLAAINNSSPFAAFLLQHGADITLRTKTGQSVLSLLVKKMPHVIRYVRESLDNAVTINNIDPNDPECELKLDFRAMIANSKSQGKPTEPAEGRSTEDEIQRETEFLTCLVKTGHKAFLSHPLIEAFIVLKWQRVRIFFWISLAFYASMVVLYTIYIYDVYVKQCPLGDQEPARRKYNVSETSDPSSRAECSRNAHNGTEYNGPRYCDISKNVRLRYIWFLLIMFSIIMALKEIFQLIQSVRAYALQPEHWIQWFLLTTIAMTVAPVPMSVLCLEYWRYPSAATGIFMAWGLMLLKVGRFPALGIYVQMLGKVIVNFGVFISAYSCLLLGFALSFCILFPEEPSFSSIPLSLLKVLTMMVGELSYEDLFYQTGHKHERGEVILEGKVLRYPVTAHILFGGFVLIITIVMMNLLVGLAVHDIQSLEKGAKLSRLLRQTSSISDLETFLFSKGLYTLLPKSVGSILRKRALLVPSSYKWTFYFRPNDPRDKRLPKELSREASRHANSRQQLAGRKSSRYKRQSQSQRPTLREHKLERSLKRFEQRVQKELETGMGKVNAELIKLQSSMQNKN